MFTTFLLLVLLGGNTFSAINPCVVQLNSNTRAVGIRNETFTGTPHCVYLGVRYALPPTGTRRFWNPELYTPSGSQNYTTFGSICPQWEDMSKEGEKPIGDEDCLFMNMYVPKNRRSRQQKYPVLVYLHGGSYLVGSAENYSIFGVDLLIDNEVLVIAVNYRLYVLGFLRVPEWNVTGNFGLKDQRAALQWIQRYIAAFGGDPDRVTLMGHSAGAASAAHHLYSASSRGLFHRLILIGGTNINPFAFRRVEVPNMSEKLKTRFNVSSLEELQRLNVSELYGSRILRDVFFFNDVISYFTPNLEDPADPEAVIAESPYELVQRKPANQVPIMMGLTATEMEKIQFKRNEFFVGKKVPMKHEQVVPNIYKLVAHELKSIEFATFVGKLLNMVSAYYPMKRLARQLLDCGNDQPLYYFRFEYDGRFGYSKRELSKGMIREHFYGAVHGDDLAYVFSPYIVREALANRSAFREEWEVHKKMVELVTSFVKFGNPTPEEQSSDVFWPTYNRGNTTERRYLNIDKEFEVRIERDDQNYYYQFWEPIYQCLYYFDCDAMDAKVRELPEGDYSDKRFTNYR